MTGDSEDGRGKMTLAFRLAALEELADPRAAFADARRWSRHVGVVADDGRAVETFVRRHGIRQDYEIGDLDAQSVLSRLKWEADTERYVLVGGGERDRDLAEYVGWEYLPIESAADEVGWTLAGNLGVLGRARYWLVRRLRFIPPG